MPKERPKKSELARFKALEELGHTPNAIGKITGRDPKTVRKYLFMETEVFNDPAIKGLIERIKSKELDDLTLLSAKARKRLHELLDEGNTKAIETTAVLDRTFQQRRLLEEKSTSHISFIAHINELDRLLEAEEEETKKIEE